MTARTVYCVRLGRAAYSEVLALQTALFTAKTAERKQARLAKRELVPTVPDFVLVVEHSRGVFTMGRRDTTDGFLAPALRDAARHDETSRGSEPDNAFFHIRRGGGLTWHGPGQLTVYPIVGFRDLWRAADATQLAPSPMHWFTDRLEEAMIQTAAKCGVAGGHRGHVGVWVTGPDGVARKVGFVGLQAAEWVSMHGCSLNVSNSLAPFDDIVMCELPGRQATTLQREGSDASVDTAGEHLVRSLLQECRCADPLWVSAEEALQLARATL